MKTGYWVTIFAILMVACSLASVLLLAPLSPAQQVEVWSEGNRIDTLRLDMDQELTVESTYGTNVITIRDGAVAVTEADCPDGYCMRRGFCQSGSDIVCLLNRLVLRFVGEQKIDGVAG